MINTGFNKVDTLEFIDTVNGYDIYKYDRYTCKQYSMPFPTYAAFLENSVAHPVYEECSLENLDELITWCESN